MVFFASFRARNEVVFCCFGRVTKAYSLCFEGWLAARGGKQLEKLKNKLFVLLVFQKGR